MDLVTLTDHNSIDGVKVMLDAGLEDVFISAEMTATFPEDGCNIHVTAANISEAEFAEIDRLRPQRLRDGRLPRRADPRRGVRRETGAASPTS